ncbi:hypothetical protein Xmau_00964 [Xenorhabdus mauleonii]|uniref:Uncharacterized protein n=1 Tax=Xenorhabdus mauleonii TaxID=351675 RepID=A0A1I3LVQ5_9GAMM|nr:hypothetical protein [Xenorhabdus mauleonii]PHM45314.1 hypothetical protein Xmau_00964 [Xenorhabdus mauleonii]SFI88792.1 hypothetical protein SAMN05421680_10481 [Xenorhabdus mauleonii]
MISISDNQSHYRAAMDICLIIREGEKMNNRLMSYITFVGVWIVVTLAIGIMLSQ